MSDTDRYLIVDLVPKLQRQTIGGSPANMWATDPDLVGDCFTATVASLAGVAIGDVPHFQWARNCAEYLAGMELGWEDTALAREYLRSIGLDADWFERAQLDDKDIHYEVSVHSKRGPWLHAVIASRGQVVFDPSGRGDYSMADTVDRIGWALCEPYDPDPRAQVQIYRAAEQVAS